MRVEGAGGGAGLEQQRRGQHLLLVALESLLELRERVQLVCGA